MGCLCWFCEALLKLLFQSLVTRRRRKKQYSTVCGLPLHFTLPDGSVVAVRPMSEPQLTSTLAIRRQAESLDWQPGLGITRCLSDDDFRSEVKGVHKFAITMVTDKALSRRVSEGYVHSSSSWGCDAVEKGGSKSVISTLHQSMLRREIDKEHCILDYSTSPNTRETNEKDKSNASEIPNSKEQSDFHSGLCKDFADRKDADAEREKDCSNSHDSTVSLKAQHPNSLPKDTNSTTEHVVLMQTASESVDTLGDKPSLHKRRRPSREGYVSQDTTLNSSISSKTDFASNSAGSKSSSKPRHSGGATSTSSSTAGENLVASVILTDSKYYRGPWIVTPCSFVSPAYKGRGLDSLCLSVSEMLARKLGYWGMYLDMLVTDWSTVSLVEKRAGYVRVGTLPNVEMDRTGRVVGCHVYYKDLRLPDDVSDTHYDKDGTGGLGYDTPKKEERWIDNTEYDSCHRVDNNKAKADGKDSNNCS